MQPPRDESDPAAAARSNGSQTSDGRQGEREPGVAFERVRKVRAFEEIIAQLEAMIVRGDLRAGDRLPNERALSEMLGVSRPSVREALRVLEGLEIIDVKTGVGASGGSVINHEAGGALSKVLRLHLALGHFTPEELIQVRRILEAWTVRMAAEHRTDDQLAEISALVDAMEASKDDATAYLAHDAQFHVAIASAAGNVVLTRLMQALRDPIVYQITDLTAGAEWSTVVARAIADHRQLLEAIVAHDPDQAEAAMSHHLSFYEGAKS